MDKVLGAYRTHGDNRGYASAYELFLPAGHIEQLEDYLNEVLVANRLEPVISFRNSMYFCQYLVERGEWLVLPKNVLRAFLRHPDLHTLRFMFLLAGAVFRRWRPAFAHRLM